VNLSTVEVDRCLYNVQEGQDMDRTDLRVLAMIVVPASARAIVSDLNEMIIVLRGEGRVTA